MPLLKIKLNHPGEQKTFVLGDGFQSSKGLIIREWNKDQIHYRKFIKNSGYYLQDLVSMPEKNSLLFWGEWEGNSEFTPLVDGIGFPNGIHIPFHSILIREGKNTDPYVFGESFKYAICSQTGVMLNLLADSLILFGTTKDIGFELDTVFVVRNHELAQSVHSNNAMNYTLTYREETIEQLGQTYLGPNPSLNNRIYFGQTWWENNNYFSFVPCKVDSGIGFKKVLLPISLTGKQKIGHPYHHFDDINHIQFWELIVSEVLKQGFVLGIKFDEPKIDNAILKGFNHHQTKTKSPCN